MSRAWIAGVVVLALGLGLTATGCNKATSKARPSNQSYLSPEWETLSVRTLAFVGLRSVAGDEVGRQFAEQIIAGEFRGRQTRFVILTDKMVESRAQSSGKSDLLERVRRVWRDESVIDQFLCKELCSELGVDGLLACSLNNWEQEEIDPNASGSSWTRVGVGAFVYAGESGLLAWGAERMERKDSIPHYPEESSTGLVPTDPRAEGRRNDARVPKPPDIEEVARSVVGQILEVLPPAPAS